MPIGTGYVGLAKESGFGVATAPSIFVPVKSAEASSDPQNYYPEEIRSSRAKSKVVPMGKKNEASIELDVESSNVGHILLGALGAVATTSLTGTPAAYSHVFTPANTLPSYSLELYDTIMIRRIAGAKINTLKLSAEAGGDGVLAAEVSLLAQSITDQASPGTPNYVDKLPFNYTSVAVLKGGVANTAIRSFEMEINNNLKDDHFVLRASRDVAAIPEGMREVSGSIEMYFENKAAYLAFAAGTSDSLKLTFTGANISGANNESLIIDLPKISYDSFEVPMGGPDDEVIGSMDFTALYDSVTATDVKVTLVSAVISF